MGNIRDTVRNTIVRRKGYADGGSVQPNATPDVGETPLSVKQGLAAMAPAIQPGYAPGNTDADLAAAQRQDHLLNAAVGGTRNATDVLLSQVGLLSPGAVRANAEPGHAVQDILLNRAAAEQTLKNTSDVLTENQRRFGVRADAALANIMYQSPVMRDVAAETAARAAARAANNGQDPSPDQVAAAKQKFLVQDPFVLGKMTSDLMAAGKIGAETGKTEAEAGKAGAEAYKTAQEAGQVPASAAAERAQKYGTAAQAQAEAAVTPEKAYSDALSKWSEGLKAAVDVGAGPAYIQANPVPTRGPTGGLGKPAPGAQPANPTFEVAPGWQQVGPASDAERLKFREAVGQNTGMKQDLLELKGLLGDHDIINPLTPSGREKRAKAAVIVMRMQANGRQMVHERNMGQQTLDFLGQSLPNPNDPSLLNIAGWSHNQARLDELMKKADQDLVNLNPSFRRQEQQAPTAPQMKTKTVGGKTYVNRNGKWFAE